MAGRGPTPKPAEERRTRHQPIRGEWQAASLTGWQHGDTPTPPAGLLRASKEAWATWMASWFAAHWTPSDLPGLRQVIRLYDQVERNEFARSTELRQMMDNYGITPKGQQDRRWQAPKPEDVAQTPTEDTADPYRRLRAV